MEVWLILAETLNKQKLNFCRYALFHMKTRVCLKYFVGFCRLIFICIKLLDLLVFF